MQIEIPPAAESLVRQRAKEAGIDDVHQFVLQRALCGDDDLAAMEAAAGDPRATQLILDGLRSGPATLMTADDWKHLRESVRRQLTTKTSSA